MNSNKGTNSSNNSFWQNLFAPDSVALIGASNTPGTWGFNIMWRLLASERRIYPVNPNVSEVMGKPAYRRLTDIPDSIDLVVVVVRASLVSAVLQECIQKGVNVAVVISLRITIYGETIRTKEARWSRLPNQSINDKLTGYEHDASRCMELWRY